MAFVKVGDCEILNVIKNDKDVEIKERRENKKNKEEEDKENE